MSAVQTQNRNKIAISWFFVQPNMKESPRTVRDYFKKLHIFTKAYTKDPKLVSSNSNRIYQPHNTKDHNCPQCSNLRIITFTQVIKYPTLFLNWNKDKWNSSPKLMKNYKLYVPFVINKPNAWILIILIIIDYIEKV